MNVQRGETVVVWFSCGAASAVAAWVTLQRYPDCTVRIVNNPVVEEDEDNRRFLKDVATWLNVSIETATAPNYPSCSAVDVWARRKYMSGINGAPCTLELKKMAREAYEKRVNCDWHVLGFTADEAKRYERFVKTERANVLPVLIEANLTKDDCYKIVADAGVKLPRVYFQGYPNANCIGCVKATSPTYWNHVRKVHPEIFRQRAEQSREIGARLARYKGERVFLDELPPDAKGRSMKTMSIDCGIFCEERQEYT